MLPDPALPDLDRARLRSRLPRLHQHAEHGPHRGQLRGQQPDRVGPAAGDTDAKAQYRNQILRTARRPTARSRWSRSSVVPTPIFVDGNGDGTTTSLGDTAEVQITCTFGVITPVISSIVGQHASRCPRPVDLPGQVRDDGHRTRRRRPRAALRMPRSPETAPCRRRRSRRTAPSPSSSATRPAVRRRAGRGSSPAGHPPPRPHRTPDSSRSRPRAPTRSSCRPSNILGSSIATMSVTVTAASAVDFIAASPNPAAGAPGLNVTFADDVFAGGHLLRLDLRGRRGRRHAPGRTRPSHTVQHRRGLHGDADGHVPRTDRRRHRDQDRTVHDRASRSARPRP